MKLAINVNLFGILGVIKIALKLFISVCVQIVCRKQTEISCEEEKEKPQESNNSFVYCHCMIYRLQYQLIESFILKTLKDFLINLITKQLKEEEKFRLKSAIQLKYLWKVFKNLLIYALDWDKCSQKLITWSNFFMMNDLSFIFLLLSTLRHILFVFNAFEFIFRLHALHELPDPCERR